MSEEEIIKILENTIKTSLAGQWDYSAIEIAIKGLLDLYNNLKSKNGCLTKEIALMKSYNISENYISKDKIREKIESIENSRITVCNESLNYQMKIQDETKIEVLKELLEE